MRFDPPAQLSHLPGLDIGCGNGHRLEHLPGRWTGIDISPGELKLARARFPQHEFVQGDAQRLPFPAHSFRAVILHHLIEHLSSWEAGLSEACRVLAPGGVLWLQFPNGRSWMERMNRAAGQLAALERFAFAWYDHQHLLDPRLVEQRLASHGMEIEVIERHHALYAVASAAAVFGYQFWAQPRGLSGSDQVLRFSRKLSGSLPMKALYVLDQPVVRLLPQYAALVDILARKHS